MAIGLGRNRRLGIPKVNQNPRPPNERRAAVAKRTIAAKPVRAAIGPARTAAKPPTAPPATTQLSAPPTPANQPVTATPTPQTQASASPFQVPSYDAKGGADPRDAAYWANLNKLLFTANQEYGQSLQEQTMADSAYQYAEQEALRNRAVQQRSLGENAIRGNLSASGWLNRNQTEQTTEYTSQRAQASLTRSQEDQARLAARQALAQGFSIDAAAELAAAGGRAAERAEREALEAAGEAGPESFSAPGSGKSTPVAELAKAFSKKPKSKPKIGIGPGKKAK